MVLVTNPDGSTVNVPDQYVDQYISANRAKVGSYSAPPPTTPVQTTTKKSIQGESTKATARERIEEKKKRLKEQEYYYNVVTGKDKGVKTFEGLSTKEKRAVLKSVSPIALAQQGILAPSENIAFRSEGEYSSTLEKNFKSYILTGDTGGINRYLQEIYEREGPRAAFKERERLISMGVKHTSLEGARQAGGTGARPQRLDKEAEQRRSAQKLKSGQALLNEAMFGKQVKGELGATFDTRFPTIWTVEGKEFTSKKEAEDYSAAFVGPRKITPQEEQKGTIIGYEVNGKQFKTLKEAEEYAKTQTVTETVPLFLLPNPVTEKDTRNPIKKELEKAYSFLESKSLDQNIRGDTEGSREAISIGKVGLTLAGGILNVAESIDTSIGKKVKDIRGWQGPEQELQPIVFKSEPADVIPFKALVEKGFTKEAGEQIVSESQKYIDKYGFKAFTTEMSTNLIGVEAAPAAIKGITLAGAKAGSKVGMKIAPTQTIKLSDKLQSLKYITKKAPDPIGIRYGPQVKIQKIKTYPEISIQPQITSKQIAGADKIIQRVTTKQELLEKLKQSTTLDPKKPTPITGWVDKSRQPIKDYTLERPLAATQKDVRLFIDPEQKKIADALSKNKKNTEQTLQELRHSVRGERQKPSAQPLPGTVGPPPPKSKLIGKLDTNTIYQYPKTRPQQLSTSFDYMFGTEKRLTSKKFRYRLDYSAASEEFKDFIKSTEIKDQFFIGPRLPIKESKGFTRKASKADLSKEVELDPFMKTGYVPMLRKGSTKGNIEKLIKSPEGKKIVEQKIKPKVDEKALRGEGYTPPEDVTLGVPIPQPDKSKGFVRRMKGQKKEIEFDPSKIMADTRPLFSKLGSKEITVERPTGNLGPVTTKQKKPGKLDKSLLSGYSPPEDIVKGMPAFKPESKGFTRSASKVKDLLKEKEPLPKNIQDKGFTIPDKRLPSTKGNESLLLSPEGKKVFKPKYGRKKDIDGIVSRDNIDPMEFMRSSGKDKFTKTTKVDLGEGRVQTIKIPKKSKSAISFPSKKIKQKGAPFSFETEQTELNTAIQKISKKSRDLKTNDSMKILDKEFARRSSQTGQRKTNIDFSRALTEKEAYKLRQAEKVQKEALEKIKSKSGETLYTKKKTGLRLSRTDQSRSDMLKLEQMEREQKKAIEAITKKSGEKLYTKKQTGLKTSKKKKEKDPYNIKHYTEPTGGTTTQGRTGQSTVLVDPEKTKPTGPSLVPPKPKKGQIKTPPPPKPQTDFMSRSPLWPKRQRVAQGKPLLPKKEPEKPKTPYFVPKTYQKKKKPQISNIVTETLYLHKDRPQPTTYRLSSTISIPTLATKSLLDLKPRQTSIPKTDQRYYLSAKPKLYSATKAEIKPLIKQKSKPILKTRTPQLESLKLGEIPRLKQKTQQVPRLLTKTPTRFPVKTIPVFRQDTPRPQKTTTEQVPRPVPLFGPPPKPFDIKPRKEKKKKKRKGKDTEEFLGSTWEQSVLGFRSKKFDITYKKKSIAKMLGEEKVKFRRTEFKPKGKSSISKGTPRKLKDNYGKEFYGLSKKSKVRLI